MEFDIFPAIDLRKGRVVRLQLGDPGRETIFGDDPVAMAERWLAEGASWLHGFISILHMFSDCGTWIRPPKPPRLWRNQRG